MGGPSSRCAVALVEEEGVALVEEGIGEISLPRLERGGCLLIWLRGWRAYGLGTGGVERGLVWVVVLEAQSLH
jgi:hypothetical protein